MKNNTFRKAFAILLLTVLASAVPTFAASASDPTERDEWKVELRNYKHRFLKKELGLTREQETPFFKIYDEMDDQLIKINAETRALEKKALSDGDASDTELEAAARAIFEQKKKESEVELKYFDQLADVLTLKQLVRLKDTERKLAIHLMRHNNPRRK